MIRQVVLTAGTRVGLTVFGLVTSIVTARFLGESGRGEYFFMVTLAATIVQFSNLGLPISNTYFAASQPQRTDRLFANALWVSLSVAGALGIGVALVAHAAGALQDTPVVYLWLAVALAPPTLFYLLITGILVGRGEIRAYNALELASRALLVPALVGAGLIGLGAAGFVAVSVVVWIAAAVAGAALIARRVRLRFKPSVETVIVGFRYATKAYIITLLGFLILRANVFLLRREFGPFDLGLYSIAIQIADVLVILPQAVGLVLFPHLVRTESRRWARTRRAAVWVGAIMLAMCVVVAIVADPVISFLYGEEFEPSTRILLYLLPGVVCLAVTSVISQYLGAIGLPRPLLAVWAGGFLLVAALSLVLVPSHGAAGAAVSLSVTQAAMLVAVAGLAYLYRDAPDRAPSAALPARDLAGTP